MERTLVLLKPDALQRGLMGEIISRFETKGLKLVGMKMMRLDDALLDEHYSHLSHLPFFGDIKSFKSQFSRLDTDGDFQSLRERLKPILQGSIAFTPPHR